MESISSVRRSRESSLAVEILTVPLNCGEGKKVAGAPESGFVILETRFELRLFFCRLRMVDDNVCRPALLSRLPARKKHHRVFVMHFQAL